MCFIYFGVKKGNGEERGRNEEERRRNDRLGTRAIGRPHNEPLGLVGGAIDRYSVSHYRDSDHAYSRYRSSNLNPQLCKHHPSVLLHFLVKPLGFRRFVRLGRQRNRLRLLSIVLFGSTPLPANPGSGMILG
jgi:hypothetical protein